MISQEEYEILKRCDDKFKWVARDRNTELWVYTKKPYKGMYRWDSVGNINLLPRRSKYLFQLIQWDDEEPYCISDLIKKYEVRGDIGYTLKEYAEYIIKFSEKLLTESEEKMKKDKEWLKSWFSDGKMVYSGEYINYIIDGMDEPEKVVVPEYVAEWIAKRRDDFDLYPALKILEGNSSIWGLTYKWYRMNTHKFVNAYLTGKYVVEKEPLFYVPTGLNKRGLYENYLAKDHLGSIDVEWANETYIKSDKNSERYRFTEQEIRSMPKGDIYFEYFAVPVEDEEDER